MNTYSGSGKPVPVPFFTWDSSFLHAGVTSAGVFFTLVLTWEVALILFFCKSMALNYFWMSVPMIILLKYKIILLKQNNCFVPGGSNRSEKSLSGMVANRRYLCWVTQPATFLGCPEAENFRRFQYNNVVHRKCTYHWEEVATEEFWLLWKSDA